MWAMNKGSVALRGPTTGEVGINYNVQFKETEYRQCLVEQQFGCHQNTGNVGKAPTAAPCNQDTCSIGNAKRWAWDTSNKKIGLEVRNLTAKNGTDN